MHLPISWWVIYECTRPHHAECSAVFDQNQHGPHVPPSLFTQSHPEWLFFPLFPWMQKVLTGKCFAKVEQKMAENKKVKQKMAEVLKGIKIAKFSPDWCGSVDWVPAYQPQGYWFDSQSGHMPGLQVGSPSGGMWKATSWCFSPSLSPSLSLSLKNKINKFFF